MEVKELKPAWLDESHPNFNRWKRAREVSIERGKFVRSIINQQMYTKNLTVLDLGSGEGGTSKVFSDDNFVVSFDLSLIRLQRQFYSVIPKSTKADDSSGLTEQKFVNGSALQLPFANNSFDLIIIQDVIEHLTDETDFYFEVKRVLKSCGVIYLSTPNKLSVFNFISDPHFGLPIISLLKRESIKKYFLKYFRNEDYNRTDIAQLFSLKVLLNLFKNDFKITLYTKYSVKELFNGNKGIVWSDFHLKLITFIKLIKLDKVLIKIANDRIGVINNYLTPTFYMIIKGK